MARKKIKLRRGFKAECERRAVQYRTVMGLDYKSQLCGFKLAKHLNVKVFKATEFFNDEDTIKVLKGIEENSSEWHALTMETKKGNRIIIHNPFSTEERQQSDIMHELAHIICNHKHDKKYPQNFPINLMREFDDLQEEEAKALGSILQIPREALVWAKNMKMTDDEIANHFNASLKMVRFRLNTSGVNKQYSKRKY